MKKKLLGLATLLLAIDPAEGSCGALRSKRMVASGAAHYKKLCASCHGNDGLALDGEAPPLAESSWVAGPESRLIRIVLHGVRGPIQVADTTYDREMAGFGSKLSDQEMASLLSFIRGRWGGPGAPITAQAVRRVRAASRSRTRYWTAEELLAFR